MASTFSTHGGDEHSAQRWSAYAADHESHIDAPVHLKRGSIAMTLDGWAYVGAFCGSLVLGLVLTPVILRLATRAGIWDEPGGHKSHSSPVPYLGGLAIVASFAIAVGGVAVLRPPPSRLEELLAILGLGVALSLVGLYDDLRGLHPLPRLAAEVTAAVVLALVGAGVQIFGFDVLNLAFTVMWVVGITNALNLLDNMDGLSAGVAAIASVTFFIIAAVHGQYLVAGLAIALAACALSFLRHNFHPARIYMGDAGSLFIGFVLAAIGLKLRFYGPTQVTFFVPVLVLGIPILDTSVVTATRLLHGRSPFQGGRDHISHRLVFVGIPVPVAVALIHGAAIAHGWIALVMSRVDTTTGFILLALVVAIDVFIGVLLANVPVYETSRQRRLMIQEVQQHEPEPDASSGLQGEARA
ncbi:MAG TPA: MraY family glycosyltransferase [Chloroflexota bacterium]|nr:MraY family glycosyltransferase [Chloroflexota bacterium]